MLRETVIRWTEDWKRQGLREGIREGESRLLLRQLKTRFGPIPSSIRALVEAASSDRLLACGQRLLSASSLEEVFETRRT